MDNGIRKAVKKTCRWHVFRPWENPWKVDGIPQRGVSGFSSFRASLRRVVHFINLWYLCQKKNRHPFGCLFFLFDDGIRRTKCNSPVDCCWPGRAPATPYNSSHREELATNPIIHPIKNTWLDTLFKSGISFYVGMIPGTGCCSNFFVVLISVGIWWDAGSTSEPDMQKCPLLFTQIIKLIFFFEKIL